MKLILDINDAKITEIKTNVLKLLPNNEKQLKAGAIPINNEYQDSDYEPKFTDNQWLKELIKRQIISWAKRGDEIIKKEAIIVSDYKNDII